MQAILLGIVQGLTEFLPISSSAHLVLVPWLLGWTFDEQASFVFGVLVQAGTLIAVIAYFQQDLRAMTRAALEGLARGRPLASPEARLGWWVILGTLPIIPVGLLLKDAVAAAFSEPQLVAVLLFGTALILTAAERFGRRRRDLTQFHTSDAVAIGLWQTLALFPGISRSGSTMGGGMLRDLNRPAAARFSFLLSIPALLGASVIVLADLFASDALRAELGLPLVAGFLSAAVVGYLSIRWLLGYLQHRSFYIFAAYCALFGAFCLVVGLTRG